MPEEIDVYEPTEELVQDDEQYKTRTDARTHQRLNLTATMRANDMCGEGRPK